MFEVVHTMAPTAETIMPWLPERTYRRIVVKPNWVMHEEDPEFPIKALVTDSKLILAIVQACRERYPTAEQILVGDVPLQTCDWTRLMSQTGLSNLAPAADSSRDPVVVYRDLRRKIGVVKDGLIETSDTPGDPAGYREVALGSESYLDALSCSGYRFAVSDYDPGLIQSSHRKGHHRYLVAGSILDADLYIGVPKMKTHQKAGITGALKNQVGINGEKAYLAHHTLEKDEFSPESEWLVRSQIRMREYLQRRSRVGFRVARVLWKLLKVCFGIRTRGTRENLNGHMYTGAGSWYGNDTIWRTVYDLNLVLRYAPRDGGTVLDEPQRDCLFIVDGMVAGEGNGPLQPLPVEMGIVAAGTDPFLVDTCLTLMMGFDPECIPQLAHRRLFRAPDWGHFDADVQVLVDGRRVRLDHLPVSRPFLPPSGWRGHVERSSGHVASND